jgi:hypothetical protein
MSRIGKKPIVVPPGVKVAVDGNTVNVEGPKGKLSQLIPVDRPSRWTAAFSPSTAGLTPARCALATA